MEDLKGSQQNFSENFLSHSQRVLKCGLTYVFERPECLKELGEKMQAVRILEHEMQKSKEDNLRAKTRVRKAYIDYFLELTRLGFKYSSLHPGECEDEENKLLCHLQELMESSNSMRRLSEFMGNQSKRSCAETPGLKFSSHLDTKKSLFSLKNNAFKRQPIKSSLYLNKKSLSSVSGSLLKANMPFYNGMAMFGGEFPNKAFNQRKSFKALVLSRSQASLSNTSNTSIEGNNIVPESKVAKRIVEITNQFNEPLKEARNASNNINSIFKVPSLVQNRKRYGEDELSFDRSLALKSPLFNSASSKKLQIPTMSQLLQMKRLRNDTDKVSENASRPEIFLKQNNEDKLPSMDDASPNSTI